MLDITSLLPSNWSSKNSNVVAVPLSPESEEYIKVKTEIQDLYIQERITKICRIQNPLMYCKFLLRKEEYKTRNDVEVRQLYHDTRQKNIASITKNNFNWRFCKERRALFGGGVYFAPSAGHIRQHSSAKVTARATIVCDVLIGNVELGGKDNKVPRNGMDTSTDRKRAVYVKYNDDEYYPKYVAYYYDEKYINKNKKRKPKKVVENAIVAQGHV